MEALDEAKTSDCKKYCTRKLKIGAKISFPALVQASINSEVETAAQNNKENHNKFDAKISSRTVSATIGSSRGSARIGSSGNYAQIGSSGDEAQIGSTGFLTRIGSSGDSARIASSGDLAQIASSGNYARIGSSGNYARICSSGYNARIKSIGKNSVICCAGNHCCASAKIGSWITLAEWGQDDTGRYKPVCVKTEYVDGARIKEDTMYKLERGEFVEAKE